MDYLRILSGKEAQMPIYTGVIACLENPLAFPDLLEPIYREAMKLDDDTLDRFRYATSAIIFATSNSSRNRLILPDSILERSRMSLTSSSW
jgi:hypothetical protein